MSIGALVFLNPALLAGLLALPIIYWLLRTVPPRPRQIAFPPTRILVGLENPEKTPAKTPWWLMLIRLLAAALVILALAEPILNPNRQAALRGEGPVVIVVDNGWTSGARWAERQRMIDRIVSEAEAQSRPVVVAATARAAKSTTLRVEAPGQARATAAALLPQPFKPERAALLAALEKTLQSTPSGAAANVVWLTDGIDHDGEGRDFGAKLAQLSGGGAMVLIEAGAGMEALGVAAGLTSGGKLQATVLRADGGVRDGMLHAFSARGQRLGEVPFRLSARERAASATFELPLELRNQVTRVEVAGERAAGAVSLLDARSQWQRIGLLTGESLEQAQPLLGSLYYVERALAPFSEVIVDHDANLATGIDTLLKRNITALMLADIGTLSGNVRDRVDDWVKKGGVLVRFAGPRLEKGGDDLLPVALRVGGRALGGALSWSTPQPLATFDEASLFAGLQVPEDVRVTRQVLADPARLTNTVQVWARLKDGTPLVTAERRGDGRLILFHVTANSEWSNLPLSGLFVEMLRRISTLSQASGAAGGEATVAATTEAVRTAETANVLSPTQTLDGFGVLASPPPTAQPIAAAQLGKIVPSLDNPPGYYGPAGSPRAINVLTPQSTLNPLAGLPAGLERRGYESETARPLKPALLSAALGLIFTDIVAVLLLGGLLAGLLGRGRARTPASGAAGLVLLAGAGGIAVLAIFLSAAGPAFAQNARGSSARGPETIAQLATGKVTIGYVLTGNGTIDETSRLGLSGLGQQLRRRTAVEPGEPFGVDILNDEIAFFPILYWPVLPDARTLSDVTLNKIDAYMKQGGMIVFDTKDYGLGLPSGLPLSGGTTPLQRLLGRLDIPRLEPVPEGHVLTKSFYLLRSFPGRWDGGQLWVEAEVDPNSAQGRRARRSDGVSSLLVTPNDLASAWALDQSGRPLYPTVPGGEPQREHAFRTGINIVMYALTGNYKADQVHVPALLERLGQ